MTYQRETQSTYRVERREVQRMETAMGRVWAATGDPETIEVVTGPLSRAIAVAHSDVWEKRKRVDIIDEAKDDLACSIYPDTNDYFMVHLNDGTLSYDRPLVHGSVVVSMHGTPPTTPEEWITMTTRQIS